MTTLDRLAAACALWACVLSAGCAKTTDMPAGGSESHFLMACEDASECGAGLECHGDVCTRECGSDPVCEALSSDASCLPSEGEGARYCGIMASEDAGAMARDGSVLEPDDILGQSEPLGEPVQMAFIAGIDDDEQIWLRGEGGVQRQISVWPVDTARPDSCEDGWSSGGYLSGWGRFAKLTFDPSGRFLVFSESLECGANRRERVVVHEVATGRSWAVLELSSYLEIVADKHALVVVDQTEDDPRIYELDPEGLSLDPIDFPPGNTLTGGTPQLVSVGDQSILYVPNVPVLRRTASGYVLDPVFDLLVPDYWFSPMGRNPLGTLVCTVAFSREGSDREALLISADDAWISTMSPADDRGGPCAITADGQHMMFDTDAYERIDGGPMDPLVDWSLAGHKVLGTFDDSFYVTTPEGAIARLDLRSDTSETVMELADLEALCGDFPQELAVTELIMPYDERPLAILKRYCGCEDCDISRSLVLRLDNGTHETIESSAGGHEAYGVVWPVEGGARVFSNQSPTDSDGPSTPEYFAVTVRGEVGTATGLDGAPLLHGAAAPRRRPTVNAAPLQCDAYEISWLLLSGQAFEDCGSVSFEDSADLDAALRCAADAYDAGSAFRVSWWTLGTDSELGAGFVGRISPAGYQLFDIQFDSFGGDSPTATFTTCTSHSVQPCEDSSCESPSCDAAGAQCRCMTHEQTQNGVELHCDSLQ